MTATWDIVQEFLSIIGELKDPEYYQQALKYMKEVIDDIHEYDHIQARKSPPEPVAHYLSIHSMQFRELAKFNREINRKREQATKKV